jgi:thioredoxin-like negative regulator of GroEL
MLTRAQIAEVGHQKLLLDDLQGAQFHFEAAQHADPLCTAAALGLAECAVAAGRLEEARQQLEVSGAGEGFYVRGGQKRPDH